MVFLGEVIEDFCLFAGLPSRGSLPIWVSSLRAFRFLSFLSSCCWMMCRMCVACEVASGPFLLVHLMYLLALCMFLRAAVLLSEVSILSRVMTSLRMEVVLHRALCSLLSRSLTFLIFW